MNTVVRRIRFTASLIPFIALAAAGAAHAQEVDTKEIIVTGSSIKGVAPVGSNLTTVGRAELESTGAQTVQQVLKTVPQVTGLQSAGQGSFGSADGAGTNAPTIHGLGASASNSTLVLLNGHRLPVSGLNHVLADPNIVAPMALERVEVLADGASSVYGSDAVAGVINFITRRNYEGIEASVQRGTGKQYSTFNGGLLAGTKWDTGSVLLSYNFSNRSNLAAKDRVEFAKANQTDRGGRNFTPNTCAPASITVSGATYYTPYATPSTVVGAAGDCDALQYSDLLPSEKRHSVFASIRQEVGDNLELTTDIIYSNRVNRQNVSRGTASGTMYGTGATDPTRINPFFKLPTGVTATSATVNWNSNQLLGPGAYIRSGAETFYTHFDANYRVSDTITANVGGVFGHDIAKQESIGTLCSSCFNLALNGLTTATINGVVTTATRTLTSATALDPFGAGTSAATKAFLTDNRQLSVGDQTIRNVYAKVDGDLFDLPGGTAKVAVGGEYIDYSLKQDIVRPNNLGPASTNSTFTHIDYNRDVKSAYVELFLPIIKDSIVKSFDLNLSGRIDDYSDFGSTKNPKIAANLEIVDGVKLRGNWARSFVAPALTSRGSNAVGLTGESGYSYGTAASGAGLSSPTLLYANFPAAASIPGCPAAPATSCTIGSSINGIQLAGGNGNLKPQTGKAWSVGLDLAPRNLIPGARLSVTYWSNKLRGGITAPQSALALGAADLSYLLQLFPAGATAAQISAATQGLPQNNAATTQPIYFIYNFQQANVLNLNVTGLDVAANYSFTTDFAKFDFGAAVTRKLKFDQFFGANGTVFSVLGTTGFNTTFPSVKTEARFNAGIQTGPFSADVFYNYLGSYKNWGGSVANPLTRTNGLPTGGGDPVKSFGTIDVNLSYKLTSLPVLREATVFVDATNLLDKAPPQYNTYSATGASGYDSLSASPLGRIVTIGLRTKF